MILAIDPGRDLGWAVLDADGQLTHAGLGAPTHAALPGLPDKVIIERPQVYSAKRSKGDPNDLITLAILVGKYTERYEALGRPVEHILPHDWKGSLDPDVCCRRVVASLSDAERTLLFQVLAPLARKPLTTDTLTEGKRHNVIDAVGLAKWSVRRTRAGVF